MDYCPFLTLFGGNTPLQGFGDTRGDPASTYSQELVGQTQLLGGGKFICACIYRKKKAPSPTNQMSCFELLLQAADWELIARQEA